MKTIKKLVVVALNILIIGGAMYFGYQKYEEYFTNPWTRNGQVRANVIKVAPRVSGPVVYVAAAHPGVIQVRPDQHVLVL